MSFYTHRIHSPPSDILGRFGYEVELTFVFTTDLEIGGGYKRVCWPVMELFGSGCEREKFPDRILTFQIAQPDNYDRRRQFRRLDLLVRFASRQNEQEVFVGKLNCFYFSIMLPVEPNILLILVPNSIVPLFV